MAIIETGHLTKIYEYYRKPPGLAGTFKSLFYRPRLTTAAVKDVSFAITEGELVGFLGPNGAGKTTTLKMLSGILFPTSGRVVVLGYTPSRREHAYQKQFALVMGQKSDLVQDLPAQDTFALNKELYEVGDREYQHNLEELIEVFQVADILDIPVRKLSLGQRMKCELIAALLHKPKVLFLDEPTIGLDVLAQKNIRDFIKRYNQTYRTTILLTSHYMEDIKELCQRVIVMNLGEIIYDGQLSELMHRYAPHKLIKVIFDRPVGHQRELARFGRIVSFDKFQATLEVARTAVKQMAIQLLSSPLPIADLVINEVSVDDVIRQIFVEAKK